MTHDERRKNTRVVFHTTASVRFAGDVFERLAIRDLSLRGVYLEGISGRSQGEKCEVELFLTGSSSELKLNMKGKVVRRDERGVGIHFEEIDIDTFFHLKNIVYYNADDPDQVENELAENIPEGSFVE
ncbi:MAG: PilZ domain-containing protein [Proteobacteria bacterium]|nr:PilZ domain-containing protein [Pseudomonadota bacterium]MBU4298082.1 PilZ domain-containing protein [Pseudomonadota bacterium]MCG2746317.1 PilZ domain-containing protein [Desulfobulbaceae bacterium]